MVGEHDSFGRGRKALQRRYRLCRHCTQEMHKTWHPTPSEGVGKWWESMTPSEGVEKHCSNGIASACTVRRKCTKHGTRLLPKEWENGGKAQLLPKEWKSTAATVSPLHALYAGNAQNMAPDSFRRSGEMAGKHDSFGRSGGFCCHCGKEAEGRGTEEIEEIGFQRQNRIPATILTKYLVAYLKI